MTDINVTVGATDINVTVGDTTINSTVGESTVTSSVGTDEINVTIGDVETNLSITGGTAAWIWDSTNSQYYLQISGTTVAYIDSNGNLKIKGRVLKFA